MLRSLKGLGHLLIAIFSVLWYRFPSRHLTVIGVTGTDGKTTTVTLIYEILKAAGFRTSMISSVHASIAGKVYDTGFHVTTPNAWYIQKYLREALNNGDTHMILEVTSHGLSQHRVWGVRFAVGVITNVTHEHLDWHGTFANYLATKISLLTRSRIAVINRDEAESYTKAMPKLVRKKYITYGIRREAMVTPKNYPFQTTLWGDFNRYNILSAIAATCQGLGVDKKTAADAVVSFKGVPGRMEVVADKPFCVVIDFAHTPHAIDVALQTIRQMTKGRIVHAFGSAGARDTLKRPIMGRMSAKYADVIVLTEEDYRRESVEKIMDEIAEGITAGKAVYRYPNRQEAINFAISIAKPGDTVILTGKAHEKSLCRGKVEHPWDEFRAVRLALEKESEGRNKNNNVKQNKI
ncbi:UDP-N-acetylmuramyl-tripeptide synthetase [Patescibacteria group bacterium]|nr:UDP-N-acetylmuramyl-tripeptide synthetase [Patescibacteria group bacterium]MBU2459746.1 UDP-N-acetylmuramyl-tripeptide synthetase [Patescibacteria group bacterium]MBU2544745.1 UDP-N-acetylmuramyl-tripeptide synthetase [Patescibacteria group bacterium]